MAQKKDYAVACTANKTDASFPSKVATATIPVTGTGIIDVVEPNDTLEIIPYGIGADNTTFKLRVIGWRKIDHATTPLWRPQIIAEFTCTNSTDVGVVSTVVLNTERFADTIVLAAGGIAAVFSPANNTAGSAILDISGFSKIEFTFDMNSSATSANCLYCQYLGGA